MVTSAHFKGHKMPEEMCFALGERNSICGYFEMALLHFIALIAIVDMKSVGNLLFLFCYLTQKK